MNPWKFIWRINYHVLRTTYHYIIKMVNFQTILFLFFWQEMFLSIVMIKDSKMMPSLWCTIHGPTNLAPESKWILVFRSCEARKIQIDCGLLGRIEKNPFILNHAYQGVVFDRKHKHQMMHSHMVFIEEFKFKILQKVITCVHSIIIVIVG